MANPTSMSGMLSLYTSPGYVITLVLSFLIYALTVVFAVLDVRVLTQRGVQRPFHWAFAFLGGHRLRDRPVGRREASHR